MEFGSHGTHIPVHGSRAKSEGFLDSILDRITEVSQHIDHQCNILIGLSIAVFLFTASVFEKDHQNIPMLVMAIFSGLAALVGLLAIRPPRRLRKQGQPESLMYNRTIAGYSTSQEYADRLTEALKDEESMTKQYALEIYNISRYQYRPKRQLFLVARRFLLTGVTLAVLVFVIEVLQS